MKPIGQTFFINEPASGVPGVFITKVDIYFQNVSGYPNYYGIELQVRTTLNGVPTSERLPFGKKILYPYYPSGTLPVYNLNPDTGQYPVASVDATAATTFIFDTPVFVESGKSYALVLLPLGGNPDYNVWTGEIGQTDVTTNSPIYTNNDTGDLFLSSNDRDWIPVITEDIKFTVYTAEFISSTGKAVVRSPDEDYMELNNVIGSYIRGEPIYPASNSFTVSSTSYKFPVSVLNVSGIQGTFNIGDVIYQTADGTVSGTNTATGTIYSSSSSLINVGNISGPFNSTYKIYNSASVSNAVVSSSPQPNQTIITTTGSNTINVPDSSIFTVGDNLAVYTNSYSSSDLVTVTALPTSASIQVNTNITFSDTNTILNKLYFNGTLKGGLGAIQIFPDFTRIILDNVTSTISNNFTSTIGGRLVGQYSGASAEIHNVVDVPYNQMSPSITHVAPANTSINWSFTGVKNSAGYANDTVTYGTSLTINEGISNEFIDFERILMSRSNELVNMPNGRTGERSVNIFANMQSSNTKISPSIDIISKISTFTKNLCEPEYQMTGYYLNTTGMNGTFNTGDLVSQGSTSGVVQFANSSYIRVTGVAEGTYFIANTTSLVQTSCTSINAVISSASYYSESFDNGYYRGSRYISKNVILADTQNSEDILAYLGAYRPSGTNLKVYAKIQNNQDSENWNLKDWSLLSERTPPTLLSSQVNVDDQVELQYGFPQSVNLFPSSTVCFNTSANVTVFSTSTLSVGEYVYISDSSIASFNVRQITAIVNSSVITVNGNPSFSSSIAAFGTIPIASKSAAFLNDQNNNIVRYSTSSDHNFDSYSQFAIKIVPVSNTTAIVPRVADLRVLALQA